MIGEIFEVLCVPYTCNTFDRYTGIRKRFTNYVGYCGCCGNPIDPYTSRYFCRYCRNNVKWNRHINPHRFKLSENAINKTCNKI